jgi:geranylgeranyl pyrophosphate synthase
MGQLRLSTSLSFLYPVQEDIRAVEVLMRSQASDHHPDLESALNLLVSSGGKRIRPALTLLAGKMFQGNPDSLITMAAAIELLHTATLVHDDLIDGSLLRRGVPTLNSQWTPGATVLTGDFLFARAAKLAADTNSISVMKLFAETLTTIVNGEITQLFNSRCNPSREDYFQRIYAKTASLFETAASSAALVSQMDAGTVETMRRYGYEIGMAFQIIDDILDFTGDQSTVGKPIGNDLRQGLVTLPALHYIENHPEDPEAVRLMGGECPGDDASLRRLVDAIRKSDSIHAAHQEACVYVEHGLEIIRSLPSTSERNHLEELAEYIVERKL